MIDSFLSPENHNINLISKSLNELEFNQVVEQISKFTISELGKEIIQNLFPTDNVLLLRKEHSQIQEMIDILTLDDPIPFEGLSNVRGLFHKSLISNAVLSSGEILKILDFIRTSRLIKTYFNFRNEKYPHLSENMSILAENRILEKHITDAIDDNGDIRDNATKELQRIRIEINEKSNKLRIRLQRILRRVSEDNLIQEEFISLREGRFVLPIKVENKRQIPGIIHGVSQTGSTVFLEPAEIIEMNNDIALLTNEEKREIYRILSNLTNEIGSEAKGFLNSVEILAHLDSIYARGKYALEFGGIKPDILEKNSIYLKNIKHPLLVQSKGVKNVVPLSIEFSTGKRGHLISGPNAGGKTVALKSVGLNLAMALSGIFPIGEVKTDYREIFSSIGDHQSIENDLSTFSSQIIKMKEILDNCSEKSLILIDEIGSGTDPYEGSALSAGILETFLSLNLFFLVTTHQSSLKSFALNHAEIENDSLEFNQEKLKPTYKFLEGVPGNSYAFILAENLGLSKLVLNRAKAYLGSRQSELEDSIRILQQYKLEAESLKINAEAEKLAAEKTRKSYEQKFNEFKDKKNNLLQEARQEALDIISNANSLIENTIREIKESKKSTGEIKKEFNEVKRNIEKEIKISEEIINENDYYYIINVGDSVAQVDSNNIGIVIEADNINRVAIVDFNGMKFRLPLNKIKKVKPSKKVSDSSADYIKFNSNISLDLRGKRVSEGIKETDDFINNSILSNTEQIYIIHGKGTGALRVAIHELLKNHPAVRSFRLGELVEGGAGVTVIQL